MWTANAMYGLHRASRRGEVALPSPNADAVEKDLARRKQYGAEGGADLPDYTRHEWIERDKLHPWLFELIDRDSVEAELRAEVKG